LDCQAIAHRQRQLRFVSAGQAAVAIGGRPDAEAVIVDCENRPHPGAAGPFGLRGIDGEVRKWDSPTVDIVKSDDKQRVTLPGGGPKRAFQVVRPGEDTWILTRLVAAPAAPSKVRMVKEGGFTVGVLDQKIDLAAVHKALDEFP
jgi:hypothetical protein